MDISGMSEKHVFFYFAGALMSPVYGLRNIKTALVKRGLGVQDENLGS